MFSVRFPVSVVLSLRVEPIFYKCISNGLLLSRNMFVNGRRMILVNGVVIVALRGMCNLMRNG